MDAQGRVPLPIESETEFDSSFRTFTDQYAPGEGPENTETASVMPQTSGQLFIRDAVAAISVYIKEALTKLLLEKLAESQNGDDNRTSKTLDIMLLHTIRMVVNSW